MDSAEAILQKYWAYPGFRGLQKDIIASVSKGNDTLALLATGGGKSICFQVPGIMLGGLTIVISPLIALMNDQVAQLRMRGISASSLSGDLSVTEVERILDFAFRSPMHFLYVAPERLQNKMLTERVLQHGLSLLAVDEAHCISQWGFDFRPSYLKISRFRELVPKTPCIALTATATPKVIQDICENLSFRDPGIFKSGFERKNIAYKVVRTENKFETLFELLKKETGTSIVYCRNRKNTREISQQLSHLGISSGFYHAGLDHGTREQVQQKWISGEFPVVVATNAFGMGIDKSDVRLVVHYDLPDSPEAYFQESGRAGRDGKLSDAVLLYAPSDKEEAQRFLALNFPELGFVRKIYDQLGNYLQIPYGGGGGIKMPFDIDGFCERYKASPLSVFSALKILSRSGFLDLDDNPESRSRLSMEMTAENFYRFRVGTPSMDHFIGIMLRLFSGIFEGPVYFNEGKLARSSGISTAECLKNIKFLEKAGVLSYFPGSSGIKLAFTGGRIPSDSLTFPPEKYLRLKEIAGDRLHTMIRYAENDSECFPGYLLRYFGEEKPKPCGKCNNCLRYPDFEIREKIIKLIQVEKRITVDRLLESTGITNALQLKSVLMKMEADGLISHEPGYIIYHGKNYTPKS